MSDPAVSITADPATGMVTAEPTDSLGRPGDRTRDWIWVLVVGTACAMALIATCALVAGMFLAERPTLTSAALVLALWTGVTGFLFGMLAPTPGRR